MDALNNYDRATQEAIELACRKPTGITQYGRRALGLDVGPKPDEVRAVMQRWHYSLMAVLKSGREMVQSPLDLTTEDSADQTATPDF